MSQSFSNNVNSLNTTVNVSNFTADDDRSNILSWLSPLDPRLRHQDIRDRRVEHVGEWVLKTEEFRSWYAGSGGAKSDNAVLVCYGHPGTGKTFISSLMIDNLCDQARGQNVAVTCFYLNFTAQKEQSPTSILGALLKQVVSGLGDVPWQIVQDYKDQKEFIGGRRPSLSDLIEMLQTTSSIKRTFICVDALDECVAEDRGELLRSLNQILNRSPGTRIFVTGRPHIEAEVGKRLPGRVTTIHIIPRREDVIRYLRTRLDQDTIPDAMDSSLEADILKNIPEDVSEIFLLVSLNIDGILQETTIHRRRRKLNSMVDGLGLGSAYDATLGRIKGQGRERARLGMATLMWISHSERTLKVDELCHALAVETGSPNLIAGNVPSVGTLLACCQGLVAVDKEASTVRLIHSTLQEYLQAHPELFGAAHSTMAEICLSYLNSQQVEALSTSPSPDPQDTPFLEYSSLYWGMHAKMGLSDCAKSLALKLFGGHNNHISTKVFFEAQKWYPHTVNSDRLSLFTGLHCASAFGIVGIVTYLVEVEGCDINQADCVGNTPLLWATRNRHEGVVRVLVGRGDLDPNKPDHDGQTPLHQAAWNGHEVVVKILLERQDINPNKLDGCGRTPLLQAMGNRHEGVVEILLSRSDVNPSEPDKNSNNPLQTPKTPKVSTRWENTPGHMAASPEESGVTALRKGWFGGGSDNTHSSSTKGSYDTRSSYNIIITNNYSTLPRVPTTLEELVTDNHWGVSPPEIDPDYLCDPYNLPVDGTGEWIFKDDGYKKWQSSDESELLWLCGGPGTGKTMLAKRVAAKFLKGLGDPPGEVKFAYHFVSPELPIGGISAEEVQSPQSRLAKVLWDLLYGILRQNGNLFDVCRDELAYQGDKLFINPGSLWRILRKAMQGCEPEPVYILIDGVDELKESLSEELVSRILGLMTIRGVKIFLSSRDSPHISNSLPECTRINLNTNSSVEKDLETFIRRRIMAFKVWGVDQKERAIKTLLAKSEGTFLWTSLAVENLKFCTGLDPEYSLEKFPLELKDVYRKMLHDVRSNEVLEVILNVALALRPLTFDELRHMLAWTVEDEAKTAQQRSPGGVGRRIQLKTMVEILQYVRSSQSFLRETTTHVSIIHHTAVEYLFDQTLQGSLRVPPKSKLDLKISWGCFQYLHYAFADPEEPPSGNDWGRHDRSRESSPEQNHEGEPAEPPWEVARRNPQGAVAEWPYLRYAAQSWLTHARRSIEIADRESWDDPTRNWLKHQFFTSDAMRMPYIELCGDPKMKVLAEEQTPLHVAVCLGLKPLVEKALLDSNAGRRGTSNNQSPLHLAAKFISGAYEILIAKGGSSLATAQDHYGNTPLHEAAISGHRPMLAGLAEKFATPRYRVHSDKIDKQNRSGNTPLHLAVQLDHPDIVKFLVENHADLAIRNHQGATALELGARLRRGDCLDVLERAKRIQ